MSSDLAKRLNAHSSTVPKGQLRDDLRTTADELERLSTPTDVVDRREAIARSVYEEIRSWGDPVEIWDDLHPNDRAFIASLIAGPPEGFVVVPREPTEAMLAAWATSDKYKDDWRKDCAVGWSAMIAARPRTKGV